MLFLTITPILVVPFQSFHKILKRDSLFSCAQTKYYFVVSARTSYIGKLTFRVKMKIIPISHRISTKKFVPISVVIQPILYCMTLNCVCSLYPQMGLVAYVEISTPPKYSTTFVLYFTLCVMNYVTFGMVFML